MADNIINQYTTTEAGASAPLSPDVENHEQVYVEWLSSFSGLENNNQLVLDQLSKAGAKLDNWGKGGNTNLHQAIKDGHVGFVEKLLEEGMLSFPKKPRIVLRKGYWNRFRCFAEPNLNSRDKNGDTVLHLAAERGYTHLIKILIVAGVKLDIFNRSLTPETPFHVAAANGRLESCQLLFEAASNKPRRQTLFFVPQSYSAKVRKMRVKNHISIDAAHKKGETALMAAATEGHMEVVKWLYEQGADINATNEDGFTALSCAVEGGHIDVVRWLYGISEKFESSNEKMTEDEWLNGALALAAAGGHTEVVEWLHALGADINVYDAVQGPALMLAAKGGYIDTMKYLCKKGADINACDSLKSTALMMAAGGGHTEIVQYLFKRGADINACDIFENTALMMAAEYGHTEIVKYLCKVGVKGVNCVVENKTPLCSAVEQHDLEMIRCLVEHGANVQYQEPFRMRRTIWEKLVIGKPADLIEAVKEGKAIRFFYKSDGTCCWSCKDNGSADNKMGFVKREKDRADILNSWKNWVEVVQYLLKKDINTHFEIVKFDSSCTSEKMEPIFQQLIEDFTEQGRKGDHKEDENNDGLLSGVKSILGFR